MSIITITRTEQFSKQTESFDIYIDDEKVGSLRFGESRNFEVSPGKHKVVAKRSWVSSSQPIEVNVSDNENTTIKLSCFKYGWMVPYIFIIAGGVFYYLFASFSKYDFSPIIFIFVPLFFYLIYKVVYERKNDLRLEQLH